MSWSFRIGRLFGSELRVHATFFLLLLWIGVVAYAEGGWPAAVGNVAFILALFFCVVAHEYGHALTARLYGIRTPDITLLPIGGLARLERMPDNPREEITVALAGPAVNVVIWLVLVGLLGAETDMAGLSEVDNSARTFLGQLAAVNLLLAVFNMIPAFPMDGGRVLRALLAIRLGRARATRAAARAGQVLAFLMGLWGLLAPNPILILIAFFIFAAAAAESSEVTLRSEAEGLSARAGTITAFEALRPDDGFTAMTSALLRTTQHEFPVLDPDGGLSGFVTRDAIFRAAEEGRAPRVELVMQTGIPSVELGAPLIEVLEALTGPEVPAVAVTDREGRFLGYITRENLGELMVLRRHGSRWF